MGKYLKIVLILSIIGASIFLIKDWQKNKIEFQRVSNSNGWYTYSNDFIRFMYPRKLRNCHECSMNTGGIYKVMTDGEYIIMMMSNQNSSYLINPNVLFGQPRNEKLVEVRMKIDSIAKENNLTPTDSFVMENLQIQEIQLDLDSSKMKYELNILGETIFAEINPDEFNDCGFASWKYWKLKREGNKIKKFGFGLESGRLFIKENEEEAFFEFQKVKRRNLYTISTEDLGRKDLARFFRSIQMK